MQALSILKCSERCLNLIDMTPREKAFELLYKVCCITDKPSNYIETKELALICVDEILDSSLYYFDEMDKYVIYWQQVKNEIEKL